jgi:Protein of unknown function (DUF2752)
MTGQRVAAAGVAAAALANLSVPGRPATLCPFRAITGIPCPFCGGTTAAVRIGHFDLLGALRANPVVVVGAIAVMAIPVLTSLPRIAAVRAARRSLSRRPTRSAWAIIAAALIFSEVWQLFRFGIL